MKVTDCRALALSVCLAAAACTCDPGTMNPPPCTRRSCDSLQCGELTDGCNGILRCGACPAGQTCGAGGAPNTCGTGTCTAKTCFELGKNCNLVSDGCSKLLDCGRCMRPTDCGANGKPNVCGGPSCIKASCGAVCGQPIDDDCGGVLRCDAGCSGPFETCGGGAEEFRCGCTRRTCQGLGKNCGSSDDGCGQTLNCGSCGDDAGTCGGGGFEGICGTCSGAGGRVCTGSCWCWDDPRPFGGIIGAIAGVGSGEVWLFSGGGLFARGNSVTGFTGMSSSTRGTPRNAWARSVDDIYAVTNQQGELLVHWDGVAWAPVQVPTQQALTGVWGLPSGEVWAVSSAGAVLHLENGSWSTQNPMTATTFDDVWASASDDVWVGGTDLLHFDGGSWSVTPTTLRVFDLHGTARDDVWYAGSAGLFHFDGTRWTSSLTGGQIQRVWAISPTDVWAGAFGGLVMHFDGVDWSTEELGTTEPVTALWAPGPNDVWVATLSMLFHRDANGWRTVSSVPGDGFSAVHVVSATDAFAVGDRGRIVRYDGTAWTPVTSGTPSLLAGISGAGDRLWAVGAAGVIVGRRGDAGWAREASTVTTALEAVHAVSAGEAYAVGSGSVMLSTDGGGSWARLPAPQGGFTGIPRAVWGTSDHDLWVGESSGRVRRLTDAGWTQYVTGATGEVVGLWGSGGEVFAAVGLAAQAVALRFTDGGWQMLGGTSGASFDSVWGRSPTDVWFSGTGGLVQHWTGTVLERVRSGTEHPLWGISGDPSSSSVWAVGGGSSVVRIDVPSPGRLEPVNQTRVAADLTGVLALSRDDVWAIGGAAPHHYDGRSWRTSAPALNGSRLLALWGAGANDVWATGLNGRVVHWDGGTWGEVYAPVFNNADPTSLWGAESNAVWATAYNVLARWNGTQWVRESLGSTAHLYAVHGTAVNDVWAVGSEIFHFDGVSWKLVLANTPADLRTIWCASRTECWAAGGTALMKWEGSVWTERITPTPFPAVIWGHNTRDMYLFSSDGEVFHWDGVKFTRQFSGTSEVLRAASGTDAGTWAVGKNTIVFHPP